MRQRSIAEPEQRDPLGQRRGQRPQNTVGNKRQANRRARKRMKFGNEQEPVEQPID